VTDINGLLKRQAEWQKLQAALTWEEKVRMAELVREDVAKLRHDFAQTPNRISALTPKRPDPKS